jgi:hypothetical protein
VDILNSEKLQNLLQKEGEICVSIYLPTHSTGREQQQDPIRLKNLLSKASDQLENLGMRHPEIEALLSPVQEIQEDKQFWQHQRKGLAIFVTSEFVETFRLPVACDELLVIAKDFHIKPILPLISGDEYFYVLALSQNEIRLLQANRYEISEVNLEDTPTSLKEALWFDDPESQLQFHTGTATPGNTGARPSIYHGHGMPDSDSKTELLRYFQKVDRGVMDLLNEEQVPLVLAGVDYLIPIYEEASKYPNLVEEAITGNPDDLSAAELHREAWKLVESIFQQDLHGEINRYQELSGAESTLASNELSKIVSASHHGQVESLFVALGTQVWGTYDEEELSPEKHQNYRTGDQDLLDLAATQTLLNGGKVFALDSDQMPEDTVAAIYRFAY